MNNFDNFKIQLETNNNCDFCGHNSFTPLFKKMRHDVNIDTKICNNCMLVQSHPMPTGECIGAFYERFYHIFHKRKGVDEHYISKSERNAKRRTEILQEFTSLTSNTKIFEIGPGAGSFIGRIKNITEAQIEAIELGKDSYEFCLGKGFKVTNVGIENYVSTDKFDIICSFHVLEHIRSPKNFISKCYDLLNDEGLLYIEVPNFNRPGSKYEEFLQFPHLFNFTFITLSNLMRSNGFEPIYVDDSIGRLTIIAKKNSYKSKTFIRVILNDYINSIKRKATVYRIHSKLEKMPLSKRIKELLRTY
jgi:SAM-dependent methyltransferase